MTSADPTQVLLAGDWHGNREWAAECFAVAEARGCQVILQLGDFGLWPGREDEWLDHVDGLGAASGVSLVWIDGNHEDHDSLDRWRAGADERGLVQMRRNVVWASRGARWEWSGWRFGALGGAVSLDRFLRRAGVNWWPQEIVEATDVERLGDEPLDVLATHAGPTSGAESRPLPLPEPIVRDNQMVRDRIAEAVRRSRPRLVVHGHYHRRLSYQFEGIQVEGLAHDRARDGDGWAVLDLRDGIALSKD
ncbi:MAG: metallophosphoesterase [Acidimicrobiales bacterium]|nr:metallophosphoesterase [Acidimicrobiales bacterium]